MKAEHYEFISMVSDVFCNLYHLNRDLADFIGCQFALESAFGTSRLARESNNFCGMRVPLVRYSCARNYGANTADFAKYSSLQLCIEDYVLWCAYMRIDKSSIAHFSFDLKKYYCPQRDYITRITDLYNQFKSYGK